MPIGSSVIVDSIVQSKLQRPVQRVACPALHFKPTTIVRMVRQNPVGAIRSTTGGDRAEKANHRVQRILKVAKLPGTISGMIRAPSPPKRPGRRLVMEILGRRDINVDENICSRFCSNLSRQCRKQNRRCLGWPAMKRGSWLSGTHSSVVRNRKSYFLSDAPLAQMDRAQDS
jgi:hypothetical protein